MVTRRKARNMAIIVLQVCRNMAIIALQVCQPVEKTTFGTGVILL